MISRRVWLSKLKLYDRVAVLSKNPNYPTTFGIVTGVDTHIHVNRSFTRFNLKTGVCGCHWGDYRIQPIIGALVAEFKVYEKKQIALVVISDTHLPNLRQDTLTRIQLIIEEEINE